jgi:cysteinyl-tRNA synthetase
LVLRSHYRAPIEVTPDTIDDAQRGLARLDSLARRFPQALPTMPPVVHELDGDADAIAGFRTLMDDDLQTPQALALIFDLISAANTALDEGRSEDAQQAASTALGLAGAMGLEAKSEESDIDEGALVLARQRDEARANRDFATSDALRDQLQALGWTVEDTPSGTELRR